MISTMLSGTAGTSLPESRRPPARGPWPGALIRRGSLADPDTVKCASPAARQSPAQVARHLRPPAAPAAIGLLARPAARPGLTHEPAPVDVPGPVPRMAAGLTARLPGHGRCAQHLDAGDAMRLRRFGTTIAPGSGDAWYGRPATAGHPGASGCRQLIVLCRPQAWPSPYAVVAGAGLAGRMFSRR